MKLKNGNNKLFIPLLAITIIVWSAIIYNLIERFTLKEPVEERIILLEDQLAGNILNDKEAARNINNELIIERDPFVIASSKIVKTKNEISKKIISEKKSIQYKINGVIINSTGKMLVFEDITNNKVVYLKENDIYESIKILSVSNDKIVLKNLGEVTEININK